MEPLIKSRWDIVFVISDIVEGAHLHGTISRGTNIVILILLKKNMVMRTWRLETESPREKQTNKKT